MRIWLITIGEPVPVNKGSKDRLYRTGYLAHFLSARGHKVVWWTSTFDHFSKSHFFSRDTLLSVSDRLEIRLLYGGGYPSNLSPKRLLDHRKIAIKFRIIAQKERIPDIILCSFPIIELSLAAVEYGQSHNVPVVLDMRDMWPDIFVHVVPKHFQKLARLLLRRTNRNAHYACAAASAITGITEAFVDWGLQKASRERSPIDKAFPMGYISSRPSDKEIQEAENYWSSKGIQNNKEVFMVCFFGALGRHFDLETVLQAANKISILDFPFRLIICGTGDRREYYQKMTAKNPNVIFPGWVNAAQIYVLLRRSSVGIDPLLDRYDFLATINNKAIEYLSAGLPIISSPDHGVLHELIDSNQCGMSYPVGNVDVLTQLLLQLHNDRYRLKQMSEKAYRLFKEKFAAEKVYKQMMEYLVDIAEMYNARKKTGVLSEFL